MPKVVCIDSQIIIWGVKGEAVGDQQHLIPIATNFIEHLSDNNYKILVPIPIITEILSPVPPSEHQKILDFFDKRFIIAPYDMLATVKCAELINLTLKEPELIKYREENKVSKNKIKFDCMIVAIAITKKASCIYSEDPDIKKFANGLIPVLPMPVLGKQKGLFD